MINVYSSFEYYQKKKKIHTHTHTHTHTHNLNKKLWKVPKSSWKVITKKNCDLVLNGVETLLKLYFLFAPTL